jgi:cytochrome P450
MLEISRQVILRAVLGIEDEVLLDEGRAVLTRVLRSSHPWIAFSPIFQSWWFPPWRRFRRAAREFSAFAARCLDHRRRHENGAHDLLGMMLAGRYDNGTSMGDEQIRDELVTILMSGHETTATALSWAMYELARHPTVLMRLREELDELDPDPDLIVRQPYLGAVCNETLRLHTILTEVARTTVAPMQLLGHTLPPGIGVAVSIIAIHQDPGIYPEPDRFLPERFMNRSYSPFEFLPFGGSHRRCLGAAFSDYEMRLALAAIVKQWDFEPAGKERDGTPQHRHGSQVRRSAANQKSDCGVSRLEGVCVWSLSRIARLGSRSRSSALAVIFPETFPTLRN